MTTDKNNSPVTAPMWWDGGDRAITAREKATIEEHGPICYTVPLVPVQAVDPEDPWRGLYLPARMPAPSEYGDLFHPDIPSWPDDREDALDKLVHAQGFDFHIVAGDFTEAALEDGDELYWQELRAWTPEAPEGEWRLAWKGDTEDGPYAWFVRPMALRPEPAALAAGQPVAHQQPSFGKVREIRIPARNKLDPISVFVQDQAWGRGRIVVTCYGNAWQGFWGAMGDRTVMQFVAQCDADYVAGNMISGRQTRMTKAERAYTQRIAAEVITEFRALIDAQRDAAPGVANA